MFGSFVVNHSLLKELFSGEQMDALVGNTDKDKTRLKSAKAHIASKARIARAERAVAILTPIKEFLRRVATRVLPTSQGLVLATQLTRNLAASLERHDFVDHSAVSKESANTVAESRKKVLERIEKRMRDSFMTADIAMAYILDPRVAWLEQEPSRCTNLPWDHAEMWQISKRSIPQCLDGFFKEQADDKELAKRELEQYMLRQGMFVDIDYPSFELKDASPFQKISAFWRCHSPTRLLHKLGLHVSSLRLCTTQAELTWALLSRQCSPIRNRLGARMCRKLTGLMYNARYLDCFKGVDFEAERPCKKRRLEGEGVLYGDEDLQSSSSSSSSSAGSSGDVDEASSEGCGSDDDVEYAQIMQQDMEQDERPEVSSSGESNDSGSESA